MVEVENYIRREGWPAIPHDIMKVRNPKPRCRSKIRRSRGPHILEVVGQNVRWSLYTACFLFTGSICEYDRDALTVV